MTQIIVELDDAPIQVEVEAIGVPGLPGPSQHSGLSGLTADDHPQYLNAERGDERYYPRGEADAAVDGRIAAVVGAAPAALDTLQEIATALANDEAAAAALTAAVAGKEAAGTAAATVAAHTAAADPHPQYQREGASWNGTFEVVMPGAGYVLKATPPGAPAGWSLRTQFAAQANGPPSEPVYTDFVHVWGYNIGTAPGAKENPAECYAAWHTESRWYAGPAQPSPFLEVFLTFVPQASNVNYRPIAFVGTHDGAFQQLALACNQLVVTLPGGTPQIDYDFRTAKQVNVYDGIKYNFLVNGAPVHMQGNVAGTASYALPFIDNGDNMAIARPITTQTASAATRTAAGPTVKARGFNSSALTADAPQASSSTITMGCGTTQSASAAVAVTCNGTTTATSGINAVTEADIGRTITGANVPASTTITDVISSTQFTTNNALPNTVVSIILSARTRRTGSIAVDVGGNLVISQGANAGAMYVDHAGSTGGVIFRDRSAGFATRMSLLQTSLTLNVPAKLPSFTVATLPSASVAGAGATVHVTDSNVTMAAGLGNAVVGGGPNFVRVTSNGTLWIIM